MRSPPALSLPTTMADYGRQQGYPDYNPGQSQPYAPSQPPYNAQGGYGNDYKAPYEGQRFKPKKRLNDPFFLIFFIAQVRINPKILYMR